MNEPSPSSPAPAPWPFKVVLYAMAALIVLLVVAIIAYSRWQHEDDRRFVLGQELRAVGMRHEALVMEYEMALDAQQRIAQDIARELANVETRADPDERQIAILGEHQRRVEAAIRGLRRDYAPPLAALETRIEHLQRALDDADYVLPPARAVDDPQP